MSPAEDDRRASLTAELTTALVRELALEWRRLNDSFFKSKLRLPQFLLTASTHTLGRYDYGQRVLSVSQTLALEQPWSTVLEVLKHEMAHQYVFEILGVLDETAHGPAFREVCEKLGFDGRARGMPEASEEPATEDRILERVAKLLALAESPSKHESEAAMNAAQRLMLKYNLERCTKPGRNLYRHRAVGVPTGRVTESERWLAAILTGHFFVEGIWVSVYRPLLGKRGSVLELSGTEENLEMAEYVHTFLSHAAERLWQAHKRERGIRANKDRRTYLAGVMSGFHAKLEEQKKAQVKEGLVWLGDADLKTFYRKRHPHVVSVRYGGSSRNEAHSEGQKAGRSLVINKPITSGPSPKVRLLGR